MSDLTQEDYERAAKLAEDAAHDYRMMRGAAAANRERERVEVCERRSAEYADLARKLRAQAQAGPQIIAWEDVKAGEYVWFGFPALGDEWELGVKTGSGHLRDNTGDVQSSNGYEFARAEQQPGEGR